jgi:hypothetical protein
MFQPDDQVQKERPRVMQALLFALRDASGRPLPK